MTLARMAWQGLARRPVRSLLTALGVCVAVGGFLALNGLAGGVARAWDRTLAQRGGHLVAMRSNSVEVLSSVDHFDFNWHVSYLYADDVAPLLPANTMLHIIGIHDNTAANRRNPDPTMWAGFGERSVDDMLQLWINIVYLDEAEYNRLVAERQAKHGTLTTGQQQQP